MTLYELIKKTSQEKGRPLKIICDWDETIQPLKPAMIYEKMVNPTITFGDFFKNFWENVTSSGSPSDRKGKEIRGYSETYSGSKEEKEAIKRYEEEKLEMKKSPHRWESYAKSFYGREERFKAPFLSIAEELLTCIRDGMVSELIIISAYNVGKPGVIAAIGKRSKQENTFGQLPITKIELTPQKKIREGGKTVSTTNLRWDVIRKKYSDFDIFIDDSQKAIKETRNYFPDRIYVFPDFKPLRRVQGNNIYHVKTTVSDLKDEDFAKAAEEYKAKKEQELAVESAPKTALESNQERESFWKQPAFYWGLGSGVGVCLLGLGIYQLLKKRLKTSLV